MFKHVFLLHNESRLKLQLIFCIVFFFFQQYFIQTVLLLNNLVFFRTIRFNWLANPTDVITLSELSAMNVGNGASPHALIDGLTSPKKRQCKKSNC